MALSTTFSLLEDTILEKIKYKTPTFTVVMSINVIPTTSLFFEFTTLDVVKIMTEKRVRIQYINSKDVLNNLKFDEKKSLCKIILLIKKNTIATEKVAIRVLKI